MRVLVTGGSRGIGAEIVRTLRARGDDVVAVGRDAAALDAIAAETGAEPLRLDVTDTAGWEEVDQVDGLVCAAGVLAPVGPLGSYEPTDFWRTMEINVLGTLLPIHHLRPRCTVTFSGGGGTSPWPRYDAYATSKAAVVRLTENLARDLADDGIRLNSVAPGFVVTRMQDATLSAGPEVAGEDYYEKTEKQVAEGGAPARRAAELTAFLLSDEAAGITGKLISAPWDPWEDAEFRARLRDDPDLATLRRIDDQFFRSAGDG
jgi:NAD(P)-dependent dehydrogenase (short-subunit alcohol dehydrogenase family)